MQPFHITLVLLSSLVTFVRACVDQPVVSMDGITYLVYCGLDWPYDDLSHLPDTSNFTDCINQCDQWNAATTIPPFCVGVSLVSVPVNTSDYVNVGCWLKSAMEGGGVIENDASVYLVDSAKQTIITTVRLPKH